MRACVRLCTNYFNDTPVHARYPVRHVEQRRSEAPPPHQQRGGGRRGGPQAAAHERGLHELVTWSLPGHLPDGVRHHLHHRLLRHGQPALAAVGGAAADAPVGDVHLLRHHRGLVTGHHQDEAPCLPQVGCPLSSLPTAYRLKVGSISVW